MKIEIDKLIPYQKKKTPVVIDYEGFQMEEHRLHRPTGKFACCTFTVRETVYLITKPELIQPSLNNIRDALWVIQNASFDITQLRRWATIEPRKKLWDTLIIDKLLWSGYYDTFGLDDLVRRYLHEYMDKSVRKTFESATELTQDQIYYAALDGVKTLQVYKKQRKLTITWYPSSSSMYLSTNFTP